MASQVADMSTTNERWADPCIKQQDPKAAKQQPPNVIANLVHTTVSMKRPHDPKNPEEFEKDPRNTIYTRIKQAACGDPDQWRSVHYELDENHFKKQKKRIIEKLDDDDNYAAIHHAVLRNNLDLCKQLIDDYKCNVNLIGWGGVAPLHLAARSAKIEKDTIQGKSIILYLLNIKGININIQDNENRTPLHHAIMRSCVANAKALINKGASLEVKDVSGALPIHYACRFNTSEEILALFDNLQKWSDSKTYDNKRPIDIAVEYGTIDIVKKYLSKSENLKGINALIRAAIRHRTDSVKSHSYVPNVYDDQALHYACRQFHGHKSIKPILSEARMTAYDVNGYIPLMVAIKHRQIESVKALLESEYFNMKVLEKLTKYDTRRTVLHICAEVNEDEITRCLLTACSKLYPNKELFIKTDSMRNTPLHTCAQKGNSYMCEKLLQIFKKSNNTQSTTQNSRELTMWTMTNHNERTALHEAIQNGHSDVVKTMHKLIDPTDFQKMTDICDEELRTTLHMAAAQGCPEIMELVISKNEDKKKEQIHARDLLDRTPLHDVASWSTDEEEKDNRRIECINTLVDAKADINAIDIRRETPLHLACKTGSYGLVEHLIKKNADLLMTNIQDFNCLEVAIEAENERVVKYLLEHGRALELMRNAQNQDTDHTPMRKLIKSMPDMALLILKKCTVTIAGERSLIRMEIYNYEFFEDRYFMEDWTKGNLNTEASEIDESNKKTCKSISNFFHNNNAHTVRNHPLFLLGKYDRYKLMEQPLCKSLLYKKFYTHGIYIFIPFLIIHLSFIVIYTTIALRTKHPAEYYNLTNTSFDFDLCENVVRAIANGTLNSDGIKQSADYWLKYVMYSVMVPIFLKNFWILMTFAHLDLRKGFTFFVELGAIALGGYFIWDYDYQTNVTMRCPIQWQIGAFGLFLSYLGLSYYLQYAPVVGVYVVMMIAIFQRFFLFLPVIVVLVCAFGFSFYMLFPNHGPFSEPGLSLNKAAMMISGEINFNDVMYSDEHQAYYKLGYVMFVLFALCMTVLLTNVLIGLAVGEVEALLSQAKAAQLDMSYELVREYEIIRLQFDYYLCKHCHGGIPFQTQAYEVIDLVNPPLHRRFGKWLSKLFTRELFANDLKDEPTDDNTERQMSILLEIQNKLPKISSQTKNEPQKTSESAKSKSEQKIGTRP